MEKTVIANRKIIFILIMLKSVSANLNLFCVMKLVFDKHIQSVKENIFEIYLENV